jgi:N-acetylmuramoyl-L-alanine amidase
MTQRTDGSGRRGGTVLTALAALVPACFAGWLVWQAGQGTGNADDRPPGALPPSASVPSASSVPGAPSASATSAPAPSASRRSGSGAPPPLAGKVVVLDPGHNPNNRYHTAEINRLVDIGTARKSCDTTGTATNDGYAEASYTLDVSRRARAILVERGATVKLTQNGDRAYGPCVDERARIGNTAHADAAVSVHADGSARGNRGFHVILPAAVHQGSADTRTVAAPSRRLGTDLKRRFAAATGTSPANYVANGTGLDVRGDLGGLNLTMRDERDAALLTDPAWRQKAAEGIADGITEFLGATE